MTRLATALLVSLVLTVPVPAQAKDAPAHTEAGAHAPDDHAVDGGHDDHGAASGDHGGHHYYTADDDGDGTPNWRDSMQGSEPNTDTYVLTSLVLHAINLALLFGVLFYFMRRPMADTLRERALGIKRDLVDSARMRDEAHQRHQELVARLDAFQSEIEAMETHAAEDAKREEERLIERAQRESERIAEQAERNIRDEATRARLALRHEAVELAVKLAENTLQNNVTQADQQAMARDFLESLKEEDAA